MTSLCELLADLHEHSTPRLGRVETPERAVLSIGEVRHQLEVVPYRAVVGELTESPGASREESGAIRQAYEMCVDQ